MKEKTEEWIRKNIKWAVLLVCFTIFLILAKDVAMQKILKLDTIGYQVISNFLISDFVTPIVKVITSFGGESVLIGITAILLLCIKDKKIGGSILLNLMIASGLNVLLKNIWQRPRPTDFSLIHETGYSFPSGHSMIGMAFYGFIIYLIYHYVKNRYLKIGLMTLLSVLAISIGISRIYLGVHYTSDVLGGFLISICYLIIYVSIINRFVLKSKETK